MKQHRLALAAVAAAFLAAGSVQAQEKVVGVPNADALFTSKDPKLHRNKQAAYHIQKDLLEANRWDEAGKWLTDRYIQHNPNAQSGLKGVVYFFTQVLKRKPEPVPAKIRTPIVAVMAEGDYVTIVRPYEQKDKAGKPYSTTWFDTWRFVDGKADEHWDSALKN